MAAILSIALMVHVLPSWSSPEWFTHGENNQIKLRVDLFFSSTCSHCQKADAFFRTLEITKPWLEIHRYIINKDLEALDYFHQKLQQQDLDDYSVPAVFFCNSRWVGFDEQENSSRALLRGLNYCYQNISATGYLSPSVVDVLRQWAMANWFAVNITDKSSVTFLPVIAFTEALNPCSLFSLLALFAFLRLVENRRRTELCMGLLFTLVSGIIHYLQQEYPVFFAQAVDGLRFPVILLGLGLIASILTIKTSKGYLQMPMMALLVLCTAMVLPIYQQLCSINFSLVFEQWLTSSTYTLSAKHRYAFIYQLIYLLPFMLLTVLFILLKHKWLIRYQLMLTYSAWCILLVMGFLFIFYPQGLSSMILSWLTLIFSLVAGWLIIKRTA